MNKVNISLMSILKIFFLILAIILSFIIYTDVIHKNPSSKHASSMLARNGVFLALRSNSTCLNKQTISCDEEFKINFKYLIKKSNLEFIYKNNDLKYMIYFIKESDDWVCYFPENGYPVASCKTMKP
jgi:hypothetical protein